jgi:hypothetical protein
MPGIEGQIGVDVYGGWREPNARRAVDVALVTGGAVRIQRLWPPRGDLAHAPDEPVGAVNRASRTCGRS